MIIVAIANQKGGIGKTTTAVNLAAALTRAGKTVLLADMDPQASMTEYFTPPARLDITIFNALIDNTDMQPIQIGDYIQLLPTNIDLAKAESQLPGAMNQERRLKRLLRNYRADYCIIDCPPSLGVLTINSLTAAQYVITPVATELMAERTIKLILDTIDEVKETELNPSLKIWRILATRYDRRLAHHREILEALRIKYRSLLYPEPVRETTKYKDAVTNQSDVADLDTAQGIYWDTLAQSFIKDVEEQE